MIEVRRAADRFVTRSAGVTSRHSFSFGPHWDPANTGHGRLVLHDEHRLDPRAGFPPHPHRGLDVVTYVLDGELVHEDDAGRREVVAAGSAAHLHAGRGVVHSEVAGPSGARFVQAWLTTDAPGEPSYAVRDVGEAPGLHEAVRTAAGALHVGRLRAGPAALPPAERLHVFVAAGEVEVTTHRGADVLRAGDALRLTGARAALRAASPALLLVWALDEGE